LGKKRSAALEERPTLWNLRSALLEAKKGKTKVSSLSGLNYPLIYNERKNINAKDWRGYVGTFTERIG